MAHIEFFFDCSSPWTYLAFTNIQPLIVRYGATIEWRPMLVGGVFNAVNGSVYEAREKPIPPKRRYYRKDMADWAARAGIRIGDPPVFPVNSVKAMRGCLVAAEKGHLVAFARAAFEAYWGDLRDIGEDAVLADVVAAVGLDATEFFDAIGRAECKQRLRINTDELIERGGFGSPTLFVDGDDMYFGNDRLPLVEDALEGKRRTS